jgi:phosphotransferase system enzyme I (PtsP)
MTPPETPRAAPQQIDWAGSRRLLRLLRDAMKSGGPVQTRLDRVVKLIAANMVAEVCSIYAMRAGEVLELFATEGLRPEAVHNTRLRLGEGLVGQIALRADPLALSEAQSHPNFAYRPETGEELYHSFCGVPIQRGARVLGVLVVQNRTRRHYGEEETEALETVAMVLAELLGSGEVISQEEGRSVEGSSLLPARLSGIVLNEGFGMGRAVLHQWGIVIDQVVAEDPDAEIERLDTAIEEMRQAVDRLVDRVDADLDDEEGEVLESYRMFAHDRGWLERIRDVIRSGITAEAAVERIKNDTRQRMAKVRDPYLRERLADLEDLAYRLLQHLSGVEGSTQNLPEEAVLIARTMGPAELLDYDRSRLRALVLEEGSRTSHVAIVARALGLPTVGRCELALSRILPGDTVLVDGKHGQVFARPGEGIKQNFIQTLEERERRLAESSATRDLPAVTKDGEEVTLLMNAGLLLDLPQLETSNAAGIGLYRTEIPFMVRDAYPDRAEQEQLYRRIYEQVGGKPVTFRTLDVGADKPLPYIVMGEEENPAMGWRALRMTLDRPTLLRDQLRALIRSAGGRELRIMFPMVTDVAEFRAARSHFERVLEGELARGAEGPRSISLGAMLEVPALLWQLDALLAEVDFLSVGSNDLFQFIFASDRGSPALSRRFDPLSPPMLSLLRDLARRCREAEVPLTLCGEMAGNPLEAMALIGCGLRRLSMTAGSIASVKSMLRSAEAGQLESLIGYLVKRPSRSLRPLLRAYAQERDIQL